MAPDWQPRQQVVASRVRSAWQSHALAAGLVAIAAIAALSAAPADATDAPDGRPCPLNCHSCHIDAVEDVALCDMCKNAWQVLPPRHLSVLFACMHTCIEPCPVECMRRKHVYLYACAASMSVSTYVPQACLCVFMRRKHVCLYACATSIYACAASMCVTMYASRFVGIGAARNCHMCIACTHILPL